MTSYRARSLACPRCSAPLVELPARGANVDVCQDCGGMFVEWFDGEVSRVAAGVREPSRPLPTDVAGSGLCPLCRVELTNTRYPSSDAGAEVQRCGDCAGTFVPYESMSLIRVLGPPGARSPKPSSGWQLLASSLRRVFGWE